MSRSKTPPRRVQQLRLDGAIDVLEYYGPRRNAVSCKGPLDAAKYLARAERLFGGETLRFTNSRTPPTAPRTNRASRRAA